MRELDKPMQKDQRVGVDGQAMLSQHSDQFPAMQIILRQQFTLKNKTVA